MRKEVYLTFTFLALFVLAACGTTYKAKPLPFRPPASYPNAQEVGEVVVGAKAYVDEGETKDVFGFNAREAGLLPVQVVFDNQGRNTFEIDASQTFLEDEQGNLWPILEKNFAYERATKYARTKEIFKEGSYNAFLGATGGALIGAAVGVVSGENVGVSAGKGAAVGAATGGVLGGARGYESNEASRMIMEDLQQKALESKSIQPKTLAYGVIFFPGEAESARQLRLKVTDVDTGESTIVFLGF